MEASPGFKGSVLAAWTAEWDVDGPFVLGGAVGARLAATTFEPLARRIEGAGSYFAFRVGIKRFVATWTYNQYGTKREHVAFSYRFGTGRGGPRGD